MRTAKLEEMVGGWFVGDFSPTAMKTGAMEAAVKHYKAGDYEGRHYHKIATEVTVVVSGEVQMNGMMHKAGTIIVLDPGEATDFRAITPATTAVIKIPGVRNDKYPA